MARLTEAIVVVGDGIRLRTLQWGEGAPPVVLVHGLASNATLWDGVGECLAADGVGSLAIDLRGHGESDRPDHGYDMPQVADDVAEAIGALAAVPVVLVGQSWGGNVVVECAARHGDLVSGVVCVDGGFLRPSGEFADREAMWEALAPPDFTDLTRAELEAHARARFVGWPEAGILGQLNNFEEMDDGRIAARLARHRHRAILDGLYDHDADRAVARVEAPVVVLAAGASDRKEARVGEFAASGRSVTVRWVEGHHDLHAEQPGMVASVIEELL